MADFPASVRAALQRLPAVDELLSEFPPARYNISRPQVLAVIREALTVVRGQIQSGDRRRGIPVDNIANEVRRRIGERMEVLGRPTLRPVINGTGVVLHTGLGRAPLGAEFLAAGLAALQGYTHLELDLDSGRRGQRLDLIQAPLKALTGCQAALVVNNNAAAVLLMLNSVAEGREVIISRGQQVEIGGSFRMPDVIAKSGARMVEVGTTNRTHLADYESAIRPDTAALLYVHPSNYRVAGFTSTVTPAELARLARRKRLPLLVDLGSGSLLSSTPGVGADEPAVADILKAGADVTTFSGDKLLGGPQAGIAVGKRKWIERLRKNPLYRTLRCGKLTLTLLDQALRSYEDDGHVRSANLAQVLLGRDRPRLRQEAERLLAALPDDASLRSCIEVVDSEVEAGSGSLPGVLLPSVALRITHPQLSPASLAAAFRRCEPPVIGYIHRQRFTIDLKAVPDGDLLALARTVQEVLISPS